MFPQSSSTPIPLRASNPGISPDAALFQALLSASAPPPIRRAEPDLADLVLRLAGAVRQTTAALREASACLAEGKQTHRLSGMLARAEAASAEQAECTALLMRQLSQDAAAA